MEDNDGPSGDEGSPGVEGECVFRSAVARVLGLLVFWPVVLSVTRGRLSQFAEARGA